MLLALALSFVGRRRRRLRVNPPAAEPCADRPAPGSRSEEVLALFGDLRAGSTVDRWRIVRIYEDDRGCVPVLLAGGDAREFRIDVLQRDPDGPPPPAATEKLALYVAGMRAGSTTDEEHRLGALALAAALAAVGAEPPAWLLTIRQRAALIVAPRTPRPLTGRADR